MLKPLLLLDWTSYRRRLRLRHLPLALAPASARQRRSKDLLGRLCQPLSLSNWRSRSRRLQHWGFPTIAAGHCLKAWYHRDAKERTACLRPCAGEWRRPDAAEKSSELRLSESETIRRGRMIPEDTFTAHPACYTVSICPAAHPVCKAGSPLHL